jgi:hypothetical protein
MFVLLQLGGQKTIQDQWIKDDAKISHFAGTASKSKLSIKTISPRFSVSSVPTSLEWVSFFSSGLQRPETP